MQFGLTETQQMLKKSAREFFPAECPPAEVRRIAETETAHDARLWKKMAEQGWTGIIFGEEYSGMGLGLVELTVAAEEIGRALLPGTFISALTAGSLLDAACNSAQKGKYLGPICRGEALGTFALLEANASWDPGAVQLAATPSGSGCTLTGKKLFVSDAAVADFLIVAARKSGELVLAIVDRKAKGVTIHALPAVDLTRRIYSVDFDRVEAEPLAAGDHARMAFDRALDIATVGLVAEMVGGMQRVMEISVETSRTDIP